MATSHTCSPAQKEAEMTLRLNALTDRVLELKKELSKYKVNISVTSDGNRNINITITDGNDASGNHFGVQIKTIDVLNENYPINEFVNLLSNKILEKFVKPTIYKELSMKVDHAVKRLRELDKRTAI